MADAPPRTQAHSRPITTLWTVCRALTADELTKLRDAALLEDRSEIDHLLRRYFTALNCGERSRLQDELIRAAVGKGSNVDSCLTVTRAEILRQLAVLTSEARQQMPWQLEVVQSRTPGGGDGVFLRGACDASSVLAVYPGVTYSTADLPLMAKDIIEGNHYLLFLHDGVIVDGRPDGRSREVFEAAKRRDLSAGHPPLVEDGRLGVGHKVNHPPRGVRPNVHVVPLDVARNEALALHPHLPVVHARPPPAAVPWKRTAVLVASRPLCGEELWLDYQLRAEAHDLPRWYAPCEPRRPNSPLALGERASAATLGTEAASKRTACLEEAQYLY